MRESLCPLGQIKIINQAGLFALCICDVELEGYWIVCHAETFSKLFPQFGSILYPYVGKIHKPNN